MFSWCTTKHSPLPNSWQWQKLSDRFMCLSLSSSCLPCLLILKCNHLSIGYHMCTFDYLPLFSIEQNLNFDNFILYFYQALVRCCENGENIFECHPDSSVLKPLESLARRFLELPDRWHPKEISWCCGEMVFWDSGRERLWTVVTNMEHSYVIC